MAKVICITNQKGGVGKTTTAVNLSYYLSKAKQRVLLIDLDPQGNATSGLGFDVNEMEMAYNTETGVGNTMTEVMMGLKSLSDVILHTKYKNLDIAPTTPQLANAEVELTKSNKKFVQLKKEVEKVFLNYDYIIIDSPPSLSLLTVNGMIAAEYLLLPVQTEFYAMQGVAQLLESMKLVKKATNPNLKLLGVVATMYDKRTTLSVQVLDEVKKYFKDKVFETTIPRNVRVAEAPSHGVPVGEYQKFSKGAFAYKDLADEVMKRTMEM
ncbi:MAG: ParA family protein [Candidatus Saccharibacteria bacterium]|nr:ParA family protein [Candidatus Saccharibacteria bacterium]